MPLPNEAARMGRLRRWILILTLIPAAAVMFMGHGNAASGLAAGGLIMVLNLLGTQYSITHLLEGQGVERIAAVIVWISKLGITAAVILALLYLHLVDPLALLIGLGALPASLVFDIFLFPVNKGEAKKP
ncbi:ATP synthase subunit I [bacterium]|nr:ATP synthase subunit I [bacterium]